MQVKNIMHSGPLFTISSESTIQEAAIKMTELKIGALIVGTPENLEGIISERDILKKVVGMDLSYENLYVKDIMSTNIVTLEETEEAHFALNLIKEKKFRHLPIINEDGVCTGMLGIRDLMGSIAESIENENKNLAKYINKDKNWD